MTHAPAVTASMTDTGASPVETPAITAEPDQADATAATTNPPITDPSGTNPPSDRAPSDRAPSDRATEAREPGEHDQAGEIGSVILQLVRLYGSIKSRLTADGEPSPLFLLLKLAHLGPSRASDLAEYLCADPSTVSRQVSSLVKSGLIERRADPADGRASILVPTELGAQRVREQERRRGETVMPVLQDWPLEDRDDLLRLLRKYTDGLEERRDEIVSIMLRSADSPRHHDRPAHGAHHHRKEGH